MAKVRIHNEYFRTVSMGNRKSCPNCHYKLGQGESIYSWGEYTRAKWYTVQYFCKTCWDTSYSQCPKKRLIEHAKPCGCEFNLVGYQGEKLPSWLTLETEENTQNALCIDQTMQNPVTSV